jgi:predicted ATP-dependent serine protease
MIKVPILAVLDGCKGLLLELEVDGKKEGNGDLFLDSKLTLDDASRKALKAAFCMLHPEKTDLFVRVAGEKDFCLCGGSFALPIYLGMYACLRGLAWKLGTYCTGCINEKGEVTSVGELAEKIRTVLGKAELLLVPNGQALPVQGIAIKEVADLQEAIEQALIDPTEMSSATTEN